MRAPRLIWLLASPLVLACPSGSSSNDGAAVDTGVTADGDGTDAPPPPLAGTVTISTAAAQAVEPLAFGQNYWNWEPSWGDGVAGTDPLIKAAQVKLIRSGGANNENQTPDAFTNDELDQFIAYCKAVGAEPVVQVSLIKNAAGSAATAQDAADMVTYTNVTKSYGVKYWSIGNEPDLYTANSLKPATWSADEYCTTFKAYATAMKAVDPTIKLLGPELSWKYIPGNDWLTPFLNGCKDVVDIVTLHRYPFAPDAATKEGALSDAVSFRSLVKGVRSAMNGMGLSAKPFGITEAHITYDGDPAKSTMSASPQTFHAGMWVADVLGVALEERLWTNAFWHIADAQGGWYLAFIYAGSALPSYHAMTMVSTNLTGRIAQPTGVPAGFSVYASRDDAAGSTSLVVLNKTSAAASLAFAVDSAAARQVAFPTESISVVVFPDSGAPQITRYTKAMADAKQPPAAGP